jgi:hypothetical protein
MDLKLDQWATTPPAGYPGTISPPPAKRIAGWANGEEPPAGYFNHAFSALADTQNELANLIAGAGLTRSASDLTQALQAVQTMLGRAQLKTALSTVRMIYDTQIGPKTLMALAREPVYGELVVVGTSAAILNNGGSASGFSSQVAASPFTGTFRDVTYDATLGLFIAVGDTGEIQTSPPSIPTVWTRRASGGGNFYKIATNGLGLCVAVGQSGLIKYSTNGTSWTSATSPFTGDIKAIEFGGGLFVFGTTDGDIASSPSGSAWTARRTLGGASDIGCLVFHSALGFLYSYGADQDVFRSVDGITWTKIHNTLPVQGLLASPHGWVTYRAGTGQYYTSAEARYSTTAVDQPADVKIDYVADARLTWMKFIDGQLWALAGSRIYLGGVL